MSSGPRRVVMVLESVFPHPKGGGAELQVQTLGGHLVRRGLDVTVVVPRLAHGPQASEDELDGIRIVRIGYPRVRKLGGVVLLIKLAAWLVRNRRSYAAIHAHVANTMAAVCCLTGRLLGRPVVVKLSGGFEMDVGILAPSRSDLLARGVRWGLRRATHYQAISVRLSQLLPAHGFEAARVHAIPNAVDTRRFRPAEDGAGARAGLDLDDKLVGVFVGRLVPDKALGFFLEAWARGFAASDQVALLVVGDGELRAELEAAVNRLGRGHQVRFLGPRTDVERLLRAADFGVLPSASEGLSNALLEYMAAGLPVLGSRISGTEDMVTPETGWLFPRLDAPGLEACLRQIARTPREELRRMGARGRERVRAYSGIESVAERVAGLYGLPLLPAGAA